MLLLLFSTSASARGISFELIGSGVRAIDCESKLYSSEPSQLDRIKQDIFENAEGEGTAYLVSLETLLSADQPIAPSLELIREFLLSGDQRLEMHRYFAEALEVLRTAGPGNEIYVAVLGEGLSLPHEAHLNVLTDQGNIFLRHPRLNDERSANRILERGVDHRPLPMTAVFQLKHLGQFDAKSIAILGHEFTHAADYLRLRWAAESRFFPNFLLPRAILDIPSVEGYRFDLLLELRAYAATIESIAVSGGTPELLRLRAKHLVDEIKLITQHLPDSENPIFTHALLNGENLNYNTVAGLLRQFDEWIRIIDQGLLL